MSTELETNVQPTTTTTVEHEPVLTLSIRTTVALTDFEAIRTIQQLEKKLAAVRKVAGDSSLVMAINKASVKTQAEHNLLSESGGLDFYRRESTINNNLYFKEAVETFKKLYRRDPVLESQ